MTTMPLVAPSAAPSAAASAASSPAASAAHLNAPAAPAPRPTLRLVPPLADVEPIQLAFDYDYDVLPGMPAVPPAPRHLRLVGGTEASQGVANAENDRILGMADSGKWLARLARAVSEVSTGQRPAGQLTRYVARDELSRLAARGASFTRHPSTRNRAGLARVSGVRSVRLCPITDTVVEVSAVLLGGQRAQAIGMRLQRVGTTWMVSDVALP